MKYTYLDCKPVDLPSTQEPWQALPPDFSTLPAETVIDYLDNYGIDYELEDGEPIEYNGDQLREEWEITKQPMFSYGYPVENEDANDWYDGCLTLIEYDDGQQYLVLNGGNMDMSWSICRAFINAGYYPPVHACYLPAMAGESSRPDYQSVLYHAIQSIIARRDQLVRQLDRLDDLVKNPC